MWYKRVIFLASAYEAGDRSFVLRSVVSKSLYSTDLKMNSFIHFGYLCSAPSRDLLRGALSPDTAKEKCLKNLAERRHVVPGQVNC